MGIFENGLFNKVREVAAAVEGKTSIYKDAPIKGFSIDSRKVNEGYLYIAIKGERLDGHDFIASAVGNGASSVLCERIPEGVKADFIVVDDTIDALGKLAKAYKDRIGVKTIGVTGSVGKTTTKQFIYSVISEAYRTRKTEGNFNNEIGLPLTVLAIEKDTEYAVLEMGMNHAGEMHRLSKIAEPDIVCITNIGTAHIENLGSRENIAKEKLSAADFMKTCGTLVLNGDEPLLGNKAEAVRVSMNNGDICALNIKEDPDSICFDILYKGEIVKGIKIPTVGMHNVMNAMYAFAVGKLCGLDTKDIRNGLLKFENTGMRQRIYDKGSLHIIEDCYNASAESMKASLRVLKKKAFENGGRSVAVLGDMKELGEFSSALHRSVGEYAAEIGIDLICTYGKDSAEIIEGAKAFSDKLGIEKKEYTVYNTECGDGDASVFAALLKNRLKDNDTVLFKASRAMKLEEVIEEI
ncbi:MAG: UDP-N-acetylmuramoyl-tripeptide--D-alanyl-D-alanine ligase [Ruminococcaceae bacterium]|nr:UDP-N-acetylmuramoyl-tripeptide--D-alanyl-D-alanine ligase [Oscillospiraceae bacterium]